MRLQSTEETQWSLLLVSGKLHPYQWGVFGERLRPGPEPLSPVSPSSTGCRDAGAGAPGGCGRLHWRAQAHWLWLRQHLISGPSDWKIIPIEVVLLQPHSWLGVGLRLNPGGVTPESESEILTTLGILGGDKEAQLGWAEAGRVSREVGRAFAGKDTSWAKVTTCEGSGVSGDCCIVSRVQGIEGRSHPQPPPASGPAVAAGAGDPGVAARALACVADVLGCMAEGRGGLRSGPAANPEWIRPLSYLEGGDLAEGVKALAQERDKWLSR